MRLSLKSFSVCLPFSYRSLHAIWHQLLSLMRCLAKTVVVECVSDYAGVCLCWFADSAWTFQAKTRRHTSRVEHACFQILPSLTTWPTSNLVFFSVSVYLCVCAFVCVCCCADSAWTVQAKKRRQLSQVSGASLLPQVTFTDFKRTLLVRVDPTVGVTRLNLQACVRVCVCVLVMFA